jgi:hypothetical protein
LKLVRSAWVLLLLAGCDAVDERYCKLGSVRVVASTEAKVVDGLALTATEHGALLAWSDSHGTFARQLDAEGAPRGGAARVAERCEGGVALAATAAGAALSCARRAVPGDATQAGSADVYALALAGGRVAAELRASYAPVGSLSDGIAVAWVDGATAADKPALALAWHDASPDVQRVWLVSDAYAKRPAQQVSSEGNLASSPVLVAHDGQLALGFSERFSRGETLETNTMLWTGEARLDASRGKTSPVVIEQETKAPKGSAWVEPLPQLVFADRALVLGYRAPGRGGKRPGLHLANVEAERGAHAVLQSPRARAPVRVGRADGVGRPSLTACMGGLVAATPRSYAGDYFIGINWLSRAFTKPRREQQFYEDARAFTQAAGACLGTHALLALAELPQLDRPKAELHVAAYSCE